MTETARPEELLTRVGLFAALGRVELAKLAAYLDPVELDAGGEVFRQGETGDSLYVVASGALGATGCARVLADVWNLDKAATVDGLFSSLQRLSVGSP